MRILFWLTEKVETGNSTLGFVTVVFKFVILVKFFDLNIALLNATGRMVNVVVGLLTLGPDDLHQLVPNVVISEGLVGDKFFAEEDRSDAIFFESHGRSETVPAAPVRVWVWRRSVSGIIIADSVLHTPCHSNYDIRAVHRIEVVLRRVFVKLQSPGCQKIDNYQLCKSNSYGIMIACKCLFANVTVEKWRCIRTSCLFYWATPINRVIFMPTFFFFFFLFLFYIFSMLNFTWRNNYASCV